jgi:plastocyanin
MPEGGLVKRLMMYVIPLSAVAVLVFATIAVAQSDPPATGRTTDVQNSTTWPSKKKPVEPSTPTDTAEPSTPTENAETTAPTETAETTAPTQTTVPDPNGQKTVNIYNHAFDSAQLNVASGTTVRFVNKDTEAHTATADNNLFDTGVLEPGESFKVYFEGSGTVTYHCELHPDMKGSIVVGKGGGGEDTTPQKQASEVAPNNEPSSEAGPPTTESDKPSEVIR